MKRIVVFLVAVGLLAALPGAALARNFTYKQAGAKLWFPDSWDIADEGGVVLIADPKEEVGLVLFTLDAKDLEKALGKLESELAKYVDGMKATGDPEEAKLNGMPAVMIDGTGKVDGKKVELSIVVIKTPNKKALVILGIAQSAKLKKHERTLAKILGSVKPAN
jgi:hypothetical protein